VIKFEFELSLVDAENLLDCIRTAEAAAIENAQTFISDKMTNVDRANMAWYQGHAEYLKRLRHTVAIGSSLIES